MNMLTGEQIKALRKKLKLSPAGLAALLKVSESAVNRWENNKTHPRWNHLVVLNDLLVGPRPNGHANGVGKEGPIADHL